VKLPPAQMRGAGGHARHVRDAGSGHGAADRDALPQLLVPAPASAGSRRAQILSAIFAVEFAHAPATDVADARLRRTRPMLDQFPNELLQVLDYPRRQRGLSVETSQLIECVLALREQEVHQQPEAPLGTGGGSRADSQREATAAGMASPQPIEPGPWAPPAKQARRRRARGRDRLGLAQRPGPATRGSGSSCCRAAAFRRSSCGPAGRPRGDRRRWHHVLTPRHAGTRYAICRPAAAGAKMSRMAAPVAGAPTIEELIEALDPEVRAAIDDVDSTLIALSLAQSPWNRLRSATRMAQTLSRIRDAIASQGG
jgi:hypothetical protein